MATAELTSSGSDLVAPTSGLSEWSYEEAFKRNRGLITEAEQEKRIPPFVDAVRFCLSEVLLSLQCLAVRFSNFDAEGTRCARLRNGLYDSFCLVLGVE